MKRTLGILAFALVLAVTTLASARSQTAAGSCCDPNGACCDDSKHATSVCPLKGAQVSTSSCCNAS
jgi:hypothetical protein